VAGQVRLAVQRAEWFVRLAVARLVEREPRAAVLAQSAVEREPGRQAAAEFAGSLQVAQRVQATLQARAVSLVSRVVVSARQRAFLQERQAASAERLPAFSQALRLGRA
jgi:hypothetical protein